MNPPHERQWRCIQRYEGAWNDPNAPYYGGLQMDISFQRAYGGELLRAQGHGRQLDAARADVGRRARVPERPRLHALAEHGALLRAARSAASGSRLGVAVSRSSSNSAR